MRECFLIDAIRTPRGRLSRPKKNFVGELANVHPTTLGAILADAIVDRNPGLPSEKIEDLIYATTIAVKEQAQDIARWIVLASKLPVTVSGVHLNRFCSGALQANAFANASIRVGDYDAVLAGGGEHMNRVPMGSDRNDPDRLPITPEIRKKYCIVPQGVSAELIAEKYNISQDEINAFSVDSQKKAHAATEAGKFKNEIIPIPYMDAHGEQKVLDRDTHINPETTIEKVNALPRPFKENGLIHAAASSGICDGASMALWVSEDIARRYNLKPRARVVSVANWGVDPKEMLDGVIPGTQLALKRAGLKLDQIDRFEINEAFASVPLAWMKTLNVSKEKVNVNGGAIAMGHPLGSTGGILLATLINELERENLRYGLITLCAAQGMSGTMIIERIQ
ncbi:thiolase family protein [Desulfosarcina sp. OttesenSCG-928-A07]|nr:thiolase family protein [Desulfosarcina sp. OttesenSCG-928-G17]MDL2328985.1 thiolase family protein [Desulfosarcina sp. OttesenSCG-928-A07]